MSLEGKKTSMSSQTLPKVKVYEAQKIFLKLPDPSYTKSNVRPSNVEDFPMWLMILFLECE